MSIGSDPTEPRRFCRFSPTGAVSEGYWPLPEDGLCLSAFLLLSPPERPDAVLVGRIEPHAPWERIGGLDARRIRANTGGWMLPSSQLLFFEGPAEAARRVLDEQLDLRGLPLDGPTVVSEVYRSPRHPERARHWDLQFLFRGTLRTATPPASSAWAELAFVEPSTTPRTAFTRSHDEILELAGYRFDRRA